MQRSTETKCWRPRSTRSWSSAGCGDESLVRRMLLALLIVLSVPVQANPAAARVAVLMSARVEEYDEAVRGFKGAIPSQTVTVYDMDGDLERGRKQLDEIDSKKPDLIFAVGIWALRAVVSRPPSAPVVYAMVLNPPSVI